MEFKTTQKYIKQFDKRAEFDRRLSEWQQANKTTGVPSAYSLGLRRVAYSVGVYGVNGCLYEDIETGEYIGVPCRGYNVYVY